MGRSEGAVNSQILIYFYSLQFCKIPGVWGKKAAHCDRTVSGGCASLSHWAIWFLKAPTKLHGHHYNFPKGLFVTLIPGVEYIGLSNFGNSIFVSIWFVLIFFEATSYFFPQHRWVWQHFRLNKHLSGHFKIWALCKVLSCQALFFTIRKVYWQFNIVMFNT